MKRTDGKIALLRPFAEKERLPKPHFPIIFLTVVDIFINLLPTAAICLHHDLGETQFLFGSIIRVLSRRLSPDGELYA